jgi:RecQ-mediated genome instability protein 1
MANASNSHEILAHLATKSLHPSQAWISSFLASQKLAAPLPALKQTAVFRLIHSDFAVSLAPPSGALPANVLDATLQERKIRGPVPVQVLDVEDLGRSRWSQVEAAEAEERGETTRGREIIRTIAQDEDEDGQPGAASMQSVSAGPHKVLLQDLNGQRVYGLELFSVQGINVGMSIGTKMILKDVTVARGVLLLEPKSVTILGGKIDDLNAQWKAGRKEALKRVATAHLEPT